MAQFKTAKPKSSRRKRWLMSCGAVLLLVIVGVVLSVYIGRHLWQTEPGYWTNYQQFKTTTSNQTLQDLSDNAFNRVMSELSNSRGYTQDGSSNNHPNSLGVRTIRLGFDEANAWLNVGLRDWLINQKRELPPGVSDPMLTGEGDNLVAAFRYQNGEIDQVFSVLLTLEFQDDGQAVLSINGLRGGRLPLPTQSVLDRLPDMGSNAERSRAIKVLMGEMPFDPVLPIDGTRQARIIGMDVDDEGVELTLRAESIRR